MKMTVKFELDAMVEGQVVDAGTAGKLANLWQDLVEPAVLAAVDDFLAKAWKDEHVLLSGYVDDRAVEA